VSYIPDANTVFEGRETPRWTDRERRENTADREERYRRDTEIKTLKRDHRTDNREEIKGPLRVTTSEGHNTL
jgi:hypothetical protein